MSSSTSTCSLRCTRLRRAVTALNLKSMSDNGLYALCGQQHAFVWRVPREWAMGETIGAASIARENTQRVMA